MRTICLGLPLLLSLGCSAPQNCTPGALDCPCREGSVCNEGLACSASIVCVAPVSSRLDISSPAVRGCEVLLTESENSTVASTTFKNGVKGNWIRQPPRVALAFVAAGDGPIGTDVMLGLTGPASGISLSKVGCVDATGARVDATLTLR